MDGAGVGNIIILRKNEMLVVVPILHQGCDILDYT